MVVEPASVRPSSVVRRQHFQTTSPLKLPGRIFSYFTYSIYRCGERIFVFFYFDRIRTLVAMATYASHRLIMEKSENCLFLLSCLRYLNFVFAEMFIE